MLAILPVALYYRSRVKHWLLGPLRFEADFWNENFVGIKNLIYSTHKGRDQRSAPIGLPTLYFSYLYFHFVSWDQVVHWETCLSLVTKRKSNTCRVMLVILIHNNVYEIWFNHVTAFVEIKRVQAILDPRALLFCAWLTARKSSGKPWRRFQLWLVFGWNNENASNWTIHDARKFEFSARVERGSRAFILSNHMQTLRPQ